LKLHDRSLMKYRGRKISFTFFDYNLVLAWQKLALSVMLPGIY